MKGTFYVIVNNFLKAGFHQMLCATFCSKFYACIKAKIGLTPMYHITIESIAICTNFQIHNWFIRVMGMVEEDLYSIGTLVP